MDETNEIKIYEGSIIGNYRAVAKLGQGGMGAVYEVEHLELGTHYALKMFSFNENQEVGEVLKRKFLEEGRLLARLKHPNLTHVFDLGFDEKTQMPYFVMDLVTYEDGYTYTVEDIELADIDEDMVYKWFVELASALDYIHGEGIVHRDIKPSNLLVDKDLNVVLTDFGISRIFGAKIKSEVDAKRTVVTKTGRGKLVLGTDGYIAPEVEAGNEATPQADAYSLGVMLLRWLTGFYYRDNPGAMALLSKKKYNWKPVISSLVGPFGRRPENYTDLIKLLKPQVKLALPPNPPAKPAPTTPAKKKRGKTKENLTALLIGLLVSLVLGGIGYFGWDLYRRIGRQQRILMRQREEAAAVPQVVTNTVVEVVKVVEKEVKPAPEVIPPPDEKKEVKKSVEDKSLAPKVGVKASTPEKKPESEFKVVGEIKEEIDYGPIPDIKYAWGTEKSPRKVDFQLANGAKIELMPLKRGTFYMTNLLGASKDCHKVEITRPFWMGKYNVTTEEMREFDEREVRDCAELENVLKDIEKKEKKRYPFSKKHTRKKAEEFCRFLTGKYRSQLPADYVFRLPTEAELEYAFDELRTRIKYNSKLDDETLPHEGRARSEFEGLLKRFPKLKDACKWSHNGFADMPSLFSLADEPAPMRTE